jgi:hypothetical protein
MADSPYRAEKRNGYWVLIDGRTGAIASYPTTKANCQAEAKVMNAAYAEALAESRA